MLARRFAKLPSTPPRGDVRDVIRYGLLYRVWFTSTFTYCAWHTQDATSFYIYLFACTLTRTRWRPSSLTCPPHAEPGCAARYPCARVRVHRGGVSHNAPTRATACAANCRQPTYLSTILHTCGTRLYIHTAFAAPLRLVCLGLPPAPHRTYTLPTTLHGSPPRAFACVRHCEALTLPFSHTPICQLHTAAYAHRHLTIFPSSVSSCPPCCLPLLATLW